MEHRILLLGLVLLTCFTFCLHEVKQVNGGFSYGVMPADDIPTDDPSCFKDSQSNGYWFLAYDDSIGYGLTCEDAHNSADRMKAPYIRNWYRS